MRELPEYIIRLREKAYDWQDNQKEYIGQRLYWGLVGVSACEEDTPLMKLKSYLLAGVIKNSKAVINEDELIVGYNYYGNDNCNLYERAFEYIKKEEMGKLREYLKEGCLNDTQIEFIMDKAVSVADRFSEKEYAAVKPREVVLAKDEGVVWAASCAENHTVIDYEKVLRKGFSGIRSEIKKILEELDREDPQAIGKRLLLESTYIISDAACSFGQHYREKSLELKKTCKDSKRKSELSEIAGVLKRVPECPASTFREAVQSLWFAHIINCWEDGINANSLGRLDQILYSYYKKDIEDGRLNKQDAFEIICCLWIKLYRDYDVQQIVLGGVDCNGKDAGNELTYLMLDATEALGFIRCLSVRLHKKSPRALIRRSLELVALGKGIPFFFNDDTIIPALVDNGITLNDARNYAVIGCVEITIPGKANPHAVSNRVNLLKCFELAMNNGVSMTTGVKIGVETGDPAQFGKLEDIINAYKRQAEYFIKLACFESNRNELRHSIYIPSPYKSMLTKGCLESGLDFNAGGALYNYHESMPMGIPNVADSLASIQKFVFKDKKYTIAEFILFLKEDFPDEIIRQEILNFAPKYGNDDDRADVFAAEIMEHYCKILKKQKGILKGGFFAQPFTFIWMIEAGEKTAATPDGRRKGENLAYSVSPMQGRDFKGLTAVFNSLAKLPHNMAAGSTSAIIEVDPVLFNGENIEKMTSLLKTAIEKGVGQVQFNVVNEETLRKARENPDQYKNLSVRVSGFSQKFCLLDEKMQDHIIARTKHSRG